MQCTLHRGGRSEAAIEPARVGRVRSKVKVKVAGQGRRKQGNSLDMLGSRRSWGVSEDVGDLRIGP